jgi:cyclophilin family peptidyl-prolyl cis-trans isomerase
MKGLIPLVLLLLCWSCKSNLNLEQEQVNQTLTEYGKQNPEKEIVIETNLGNIEIELSNQTPLHRANFVRLVKNGYYKTRKFYRVVDYICIQGGAEWDDRLRYEVVGETTPTLKHTYGAVSMAMYAENNPQKMTSASEFFIITNKQGYTDFDGTYTVIGQVVKGMDIVEKIYNGRVYNEKPAIPVFFSIQMK